MLIYGNSYLLKQLLVVLMTSSIEIEELKEILPDVLLQLINENPEFKEALTRILTEKRHKKTELLKQLRLIAKELGRTPAYADIHKLSKERKCAGVTLFRKRFGSLSNALKLAGLSVKIDKSYRTRQLTNEEIIKQYWGEDFSASIAYEPIENRLYTSLGFDAIQVWDPAGIYKSTFETSNHIPRNILISENLLISYNLDSSITVWNRRTQKILFDFYLFKDFNWIAINSDSEVNSSPGAYKYLGSR